MTVKRHESGHHGHDGKLERRHYVWRPSPSGVGGVILDGVAGAALGALAGLAAGEVLERYVPSESSEPSEVH